MKVALCVLGDTLSATKSNKLSFLVLPFPQILHKLFHSNFVQKDEIPDPNFLSNNHNSSHGTKTSRLTVTDQLTQENSFRFSYVAICLTKM